MNFEGFLISVHFFLCSWLILINVADSLAVVGAQVLALNSLYEHAARDLQHYNLNTMWPNAEPPFFVVYLSLT